MSDVVVIGAGIAGLAGALRAAERGCRVTLLATGVGGLQLSQGSIDLLGYHPQRITTPIDAIRDLAESSPEHPYARIGADRVAAAVDWFAQQLGPRHLRGSSRRNLQLATAVGAVRPTAFAPPALAAGDLTAGMRVLVVGLTRLKDFHPRLVAANLERATLPDGGGLAARGIEIDLVARDGEIDSSGVVFARAFDDPHMRARAAELIAPLVEGDEVVLLPAVLGLHDGEAAWTDLRERLGRAVAEVALPPPSVPGMRLNAALTELARAAGVRMVLGGRVVAARREGNRLAAVHTDTAGREREFRADWFLHAPGGFESGALAVDSHGGVSEPALDLPLRGVPQGDLVGSEYWAEHPLFRAGVAVDQTMRPVERDGTRVFENLVAAGGILAGATRWREKSGEGIAIASAYRAIDTIAGAADE